MASYDRLNAVDSMFLDIEDAYAHMHVGGVIVFEGEPPEQDALVAHIESRIDAVPRYRQRLAFVPLGLGRPVWVDHDRFDVERHVGRIALPPGAGWRGLADVSARFFAEPLDRRLPLWETALVENVGPGRFAFLSKTHHCLLDGISGVDFLHEITDPGPEPTPVLARPVWRPRPPPSALELLADATREQMSRPLRLAQGALTQGTEGYKVAHDIVGGTPALTEIAVSGPAPAWPFDDLTGPGRTWEMPSLDLELVKELRARCGGTVNDALLAVSAGALRELLFARGDALPKEVRVFVPVSLRPVEARRTYGNRLAFMFCPIPIAEPDPLARLRTIIETTKQLKERNQAGGVLALEHLRDIAPSPVAAVASRAVVAMRYFNIVISNIPGPAEPRYMLGRKIVACHPAIPLARGQSLSIGLFSYAGSVDVGLLGGPERARDLARLARAIPTALSALVTAARAATGVVVPTRAPAPTPAPAAPPRRRRAPSTRRRPVVQVAPPPDSR